MRYIHDDAILEDTTWLHLSDEDPLPEDSSRDITLPLPRFLETADTLGARDGRVGVLVRGEDDVRDLEPHLDALSLILVDFPSFKDGRGYSHATILRTHLGYTGAMRAVGDVLIDQLFYMKRVGFDEFALRPDKDFERALAAFQDFSVVYQQTADGLRPVPHQRHIN